MIINLKLNPLYYYGGLLTSLQKYIFAKRGTVWKPWTVSFQQKHPHYVTRLLLTLQSIKFSWYCKFLFTLPYNDPLFHKYLLEIFGIHYGRWLKLSKLCQTPLYFPFILFYCFAVSFPICFRCMIVVAFGLLPSLCLQATAYISPLQK